MVAPTPVRVALKTPGSKRPPPLPAMRTPTVALGSPAIAPPEVFVEGVDGHAHSVPSYEPDAFERSKALDDSKADAWLRTSPEEEWVETTEEQPENPRRMRRRKTARIGVACGAVAMFVFAAVTAFAKPRVVNESASAKRAPVEAVAHASAPAQAAAPAPVAPPVAHAHTAVHATASTTTTQPAAKRALVRKAARQSTQHRQRNLPLSTQNTARPLPPRAPRLPRSIPSVRVRSSGARGCATEQTSDEAITRAHERGGFILTRLIPSLEHASFALAALALIACASDPALDTDAGAITLPRRLASPPRLAGSSAVGRGGGCERLRCRCHSSGGRRPGDAGDWSTPRSPTCCRAVMRLDSREAPAVEPGFS